MSVDSHLALLGLAPGHLLRPQVLVETHQLLYMGLVVKGLGAEILAVEAHQLLRKCLQIVEG